AGIPPFREVRRRLGANLLHYLAQAVHRAWERYRRDFAPKMARPSGRARAGVMHDLIIEEVEKLYGGELTRRNGRTLLCAKPGIVIQFKKLGDNGLPMNYPTEAAIAFQ